MHDTHRVYQIVPAGASGDNRADCDLTRRAKQQLDEYFTGARSTFDFPTVITGTGFQMRVWNAARSVPYGQTATYKDIAIQIGAPSAFRAVGGALNKNPLLIVVPCHRIIGVNKSIVGYAGGVDAKQYLLNLEAANG